MAPHSSTFAWKILWKEEPGRLQSMGLLKSDTTERLHFHFSLSRIGEGNGNPLQCSCLENPRDRVAWWAAVYGVAQSRTRMKGLSSSSIYIYIYIYTHTHILNHFVVHLKLTHCKSTILQFLKKVHQGQPHRDLTERVSLSDLVPELRRKTHPCAHSRLLS